MQIRIIPQLIIGFGIMFALSGCGTPKPVQNTSANVSIPAGKFYFSSTTCAHCATVSQYVTEHDVKNKLYYIERDIGPDPYNTALLKAIGERCGISQNDLAVPFFWDGSACYVGDGEVIAYFERLSQ